MGLGTEEKHFEVEGGVPVSGARKARDEALRRSSMKRKGSILCKYGSMEGELRAREPYKKEKKWDPWGV